MTPPPCEAPPLHWTGFSSFRAATVAVEDGLSRSMLSFVGLKALVAADTTGRPAGEGVGDKIVTGELLTAPAPMTTA